MIPDPAHEADRGMRLPLARAFKMQPLFQLTKKVVRLVLSALYPAFLPEQDYDSGRSSECALPSEAL